MRMTIDQWGGITVTLSRRNLLTLVHKLTEPDSKRTLLHETDDGEMLRVIAEPDALHYLNRPPGEVRASTELWLQAQGQSDETDV